MIGTVFQKLQVEVWRSFHRRVVAAAVVTAAVVAAAAHGQIRARTKKRTILKGMSFKISSFGSRSRIPDPGSDEKANNFKRDLI